MHPGEHPNPDSSSGTTGIYLVRQRKRGRARKNQSSTLGKAHHRPLDNAQLIRYIEEEEFGGRADSNCAIRPSTGGNSSRRGRARMNGGGVKVCSICGASVRVPGRRRTRSIRGEDAASKRARDFGISKLAVRAILGVEFWRGFDVHRLQTMS